MAKVQLKKKAASLPLKKESMAGSLKKYYPNISLKEILQELQDERRKSDRF